jgi:spore protease
MIKKDAYIYTDMAAELTGLKSSESKAGQTDGFDAVKKTVSKINRAEEKKYGKARGMYMTFESDGFFRNEELKKRLANALCGGLFELAEYLKLYHVKKTLVVGVGNILMTADSLGPECAKKIMPETRGEKTLCALIPGVKGITGIEALDIVSAAVEKIKPDIVVAVDTLAASDAKRLSRTFQLSTAGLMPGGGVKNHRPALNAETLGVPVIAVGVPLVVYAVNIIGQILNEGALPPYKSFSNYAKGQTVGQALRDMIVTVKDINVAVDECSDIIAEGINAFCR